MSRKKKIFLIDGSALLYRSFFAFIRNPLINSKGVNTSAIYGFGATLLKILREESPSYIAVIFDAPEPTFRHVKYPLYKATREKMPDELVEQIPLVDELINAFNIPLIRRSGVEADDIIGTLALKAKEQNLKTFIVTADKDFFQLISKDINIYNLRAKSKDETDKYLSTPHVKEKFGVLPEMIIDFLALMGDSSDNVPGVKGIGAKTAEKLLNKFGSADELFKKIDEVTPDKLREKLEAGYNDFILSKYLVTIKTDVEACHKIEDLTVKPWNRTQLAKMFHELELVSFLKDIADTDKEEIADYKIVKEEDAQEIVKELTRSDSFAFDITSLASSDGLSILGVSFSIKEKQAFYFDLFTNSKNIIKALKSILEDNKIDKICHDMKNQMLLADKLGISIKNICFDTMLSGFLLSPSSREPSISVLSLDHLNFQKETFERLTGKNIKKIDPMELTKDEISKVSCENSDVCLRLLPVLEEKLKEEKMDSLFYDVEMPLVNVLFMMEQKGVKLDVPFLHDLTHKVGSEIYRLETEIYDDTGLKFNINSPKQLGEVLFEKIKIQDIKKIKKVKKSKTGYSTAIDVLIDYKDIAIVEKILKHRSLNKIKNTYIDTLPKLCRSETMRLHTQFHQAITQTGRLSSTDPNLQNIPIRSKVGSLIRKAFVAEEGHILICADYSQIELRVLAHLSRDKKLINAFENNKDIHTQTASLIFHIDEDKVTPFYRSQAKAINFGIIYGMGPRKLSRDTGISLNEANTFINEYFITHPGVSRFIEEVKESTRITGIARTILGRIRHVPEINSFNPRIKVMGEHIAVNTPIQGSAADIIKVAMINISRAVKEKKLNLLMLLQEHDELIFEVPVEEQDASIELIKKEMMNAVSLIVPLTVKVKSGKNWLECE
ncbi:MAG: DNA polymerase I [Candidatus Aureabacteria bacterium]|nr:DNA polymerase I [Candidatus Auribacterota bacterium]